MPITRDRYIVAFLVDGTEQQHEITVLGVDELRAEKAARGANVRGPQVDARTKQVTDLGDFHNMEALKLWAALVRNKLYDAKALAFLTEDYVGSEKVGDPDDSPETVDPTQPAESTDSA